MTYNWSSFGKSSKMSKVKQSYWSSSKVPIPKQRNDDERLGGDWRPGMKDPDYDEQSRLIKEAREDLAEKKESYNKKYGVYDKDEMVAGPFKSKNMASRKADKLDNTYGAYKHRVKAF